MKIQVNATPKPPAPTTGPWRVGIDREDGGTTVEADGALNHAGFPVLVARVQNTCGEFHAEEANATLMAAAPDLRDACEALVRIEGERKRGFPCCGYCGAVAVCEASCPVALATVALHKAGLR